MKAIKGWHGINRAPWKIISRRHTDKPISCKNGYGVELYCMHPLPVKLGP